MHQACVFGHSVVLQPLQCAPTAWTPQDSAFKVTLNVALDGCIVPSSTSHAAARVDYAHLVVLDNFFGEQERLGLLDFITEPGWDHSQGPPTSKWEQRTYDSASSESAPSWGLKDEVLKSLATSALPAKLEIQSRLARLYPEVTICHQPSDSIQSLQPVALQPAAVAPPEAAEPPPAASCQPPHSAWRPHVPHQLPVAAAGGNDSLGEEGCGAAGVLQVPQREEETAVRGEGRTEQEEGGRREQEQGTAGGARDRAEWQAAGPASGGEEEQEAEGSQVSVHPAKKPRLRADTCGGDGSTGSGNGNHRSRNGTGSASASASASSGGGDANDGGGTSGAAAVQSPAAGLVDCACFLGNAAVHGDRFSWHQDADPSDFPDSHWVDCFGRYFNREPGKPLFVSLLLYLCDDWPRSWDAETLFLDSPTDTGILLRPKKYRAVLMDQDVLHRVSMPSACAARTPRYSLVWKLVFLPPAGSRQCSIARSEWGQPTMFGSAARLAAVARQLAVRKESSRQTELAPAQQQPGNGQGA